MERFGCWIHCIDLFDFVPCILLLILQFVIMSGAGDSDARLQRSISELFSEEDDDISYDQSTEHEGGEDDDADAWTGESCCDIV